MVCALSVPYCSVPGFVNGASGKFGIVGLELLKADQIGSRFSQPFEQPGKAAVYSVDVVRSEGERSLLRPLRVIIYIDLQWITAGRLAACGHSSIE